MKIDFNKMTRKFLMGEGRGKVDPNALLQAIKESLSNIRPSSRTDENRIAVAKEHLREITRSFRRLREQVNVLEEKLQILEETSSGAGGAVAGFAAPIGAKSKGKRKK
tara:strand:- start:233 stop:556 length:324 start_codon:yes stop_codon:yes gene_type:complete